MKKALPRLLIALAGIAALVLIGVFGVYRSILNDVARLSYDFPYRLRGHINVPEACMVYMDENSAQNLKQGDPWDRALHAQLVKRLREDGARAIFFDLVFLGPSNPAADKEFAEEIKAHGKVFLGGALDISPQGGQYQEIIMAPYPEFRRAAAGWGLLVFRPIDPDYGVREIYGGTEQKASAAWVAAEKLGAPLSTTPEARFEKRFLNYYGPAGWIPNVSYFQALNPGDLPPGFFKDKIVFVGGRIAMGPLKLGKDEFRTPYSRWRGTDGKESRFAAGVEVHATALLNLMRNEWLKRMPDKWEIALLVGCGIVFGGLFSLLRPVAAVITAIVGAGIIAGGAFLLMWHQHIWFSWLIPVGLQIPIGLGWSLGANYFLEARGRARISRAFGHYLSPHMAERIANSEIDLRPGGKLMDASVMFTDLEGFTSMSESLGDPEKISHVLTEYFTQTTGHVLESEGTIVKFIGDAVLAVWGAPLADPQHPTKAARAALALHAASHIEVEGRTLRTRVGLHTGRVLSGNLGSAQRFDYTVIGDPVNFASRLEGINKYLGTNILISDAMRQQIGPEFLSRYLGHFLVVGKKETVAIHELLPSDGKPVEWVAEFERGLAMFTRGELQPAKEIFERILRERGKDGPCSFYLEEIDACQGIAGPDWTGVVALTSK